MFGKGNAMRVLTLNAGSRSHKAMLYAVDEPAPLDPPDALWERSVEAGHEDFGDLLDRFDGEPPDAIGHRVVHPGPVYAGRASARIDDDVIAAIEAAVPLASSHNPLALEGIAAARKRFGDGVPHVAAFDTALGDDAPAYATTCAVPLAWRERFGVRRYGFHGVSQRDVIDRIDAAFGADAGRRTISLHLGNGASGSAFAGRRIVETTMGMTPLEGLVMGERAGSIDPGTLLVLLDRDGLSTSEVRHGLSKESGLLGLSGVSADTREIVAAIAGGDDRANFALDYYAYRVRWHVGALAAVLGGVDLLAFTGPVGSNSSEVRRRVCTGLEHLGIVLDDAKNAANVHDADVSVTPASARIVVVPTLEEWAIARIAARQLR